MYTKHGALAQLQFAINHSTLTLYEMVELSDPSSPHKESVSNWVILPAGIVLSLVIGTYA